MRTAISNQVICRITAPAVLSSLNIDFKHADTPTLDQNTMQIASSTAAPVVDHPTQPQSSQLMSSSLPPLSASATPQVPLPVTPPSPQPLPQASSQPSPYNTAPPLTPPRPTQPCPPLSAVPRRLLKDLTHSSTHGGPTALGTHLKVSQ